MALNPQINVIGTLTNAGLLSVDKTPQEKLAQLKQLTDKDKEDLITQIEKEQPSAVKLNGQK